jgi:hypothetical protein
MAKDGIALNDVPNNDAGKSAESFKDDALIKEALKLFNAQSNNTK